MLHPAPGRFDAFAAIIAVVAFTGIVRWKWNVIAVVGGAGYVWGASTPPAFIKASDGPGGATSTAQFTPGFAGGSHWEVVVIEALAAGEGEITLAQRRPWETAAEPDAKTFKFKLKVS